MSAIANNVAATAAFQTFVCPETVRLRITVANAAVLFQTGRAEAPGGQAVFFGDPTYMVPQIGSYDARCDAVRFKWAAAPVGTTDTPRVTIDALGAGAVG